MCACTHTQRREGIQQISLLLHTHTQMHNVMMRDGHSQLGCHCFPAHLRGVIAPAPGVLSSYCAPCLCTGLLQQQFADSLAGSRRGEHQLLTVLIELFPLNVFSDEKEELWRQESYVKKYCQEPRLSFLFFFSFSLSVCARTKEKVVLFLK